MSERVDSQLAFSLEIDKAKNIFRQTHLSGNGRNENDAEHSWHMAIMAYLLKEYANEEIDILKVILMCLIHDISVGQRQLLTIARVVLCNPAILILDEATSSVDTRTEMAIGKAMKALMKNRTSFVIAHRLSTIVDADLILVMQNGNIIEQGNHKELLQANGSYADLYNSQFA